MHSTVQTIDESAADRMPKGIPFIIANEFDERLCYYGINAILAVYMTGTAHFGQARATSWQSLFKAWAYFFQLVGAIVSDEFGVQYRRIIVFSIVVVLGCSVLGL